MRQLLNRIICTLTEHEYEDEQHDMHQKFNVYAVCNYERCTRCGLEKHHNTLYCDKVQWTTRADYVAIRPEEPTN